MSFPAAMWSFLEDKSNKKPCPPHFFVGSYLTSNTVPIKTTKTYLMNFTIIWVKNPTPKAPTPQNGTQPAAGRFQSPASRGSTFDSIFFSPDSTEAGPGWSCHQVFGNLKLPSMEIRGFQLKVQQIDIPRFCFSQLIFEVWVFCLFFSVILIRDWHDVSICILVFPINQGSLSSK